MAYLLRAFHWEFSVSKNDPGHHTLQGPTAIEQIDKKVLLTLSTFPQEPSISFCSSKFTEILKIQNINWFY
jgi:hypothetical protein